MESAAYNTWKLVSLSPLPGWALGMLGAAVLAGAGLAVLGLRQEPLFNRKLVLMALRGLAALAALFFLVEPGIRYLQTAQVKNRLAVLVDKSASMAFQAAPGGKPRIEEAAAFLEQVAPQFAALSQSHAVEFYGFDPELAPVTPQRLRQEGAKGSNTDLLSALKALSAGAQSESSRQLAGVLLVSDGADHASLEQELTAGAKSQLKDLGFPISAVLVGEESLKDLSIQALRVDDFAFVRNSITAEIDVRGRGFRGESVPVTLRREGQIIASQSVRFEEDDQTVKASFTFTPDQTGRFVFTASVPVYPEEAVGENNSKSFVLKVIRDRVRVLHVVGRPSWDERFLRGLLRQDANVDLISFYILRTTNDDTQVRNQERELSLIPFPMDEIFNLKLHTFDVVIFQNFGYSGNELSIAAYERNLEAYVNNGGAFVMIGGDRSFGEGRVAFTVLNQAMPVDPGGPAHLDNFRARPTPEGLRHPITALAAGPSATEAAWASLPEIPGANMARLKPNATVLLEHPYQNVDGRHAPILALWEYGRGRALALMVDASWYWAFTAHASGTPVRHYDTFWKNALRWLTRDPDLTTVKVVADPPQVEPGKPVGAIVTARLSDYQPAAAAEVVVDLFSVETQKILATRTALAGQDGVARVEFEPPAPGAYKLLGRARKGGTALGEGEDAVAVRSVGAELSDAAVRPGLLEDIAKLTGGTFFRLPRGDLPELPLLEPPVVEVGRSQDLPLWDRWYYLVAFALLMGTEWLLRRRFGYI